MNIGILASGGDGAGMNACLYNMYKQLKNKHNITLFKGGFQGLIDNNVLDINFNDIKKQKSSGGILIKTSRCKAFLTKEGINTAIKNIKQNALDVLIIMGGNGTLRASKELASLGVNVLFVPCTIDNDVAGSEYCIGFDTACFNCTQFIKHVNTTMLSFNRTCIYEAMGRECPKIAIEVAKNVNADYWYIDASCSAEQCVEAVKNSKKDAPIIILREHLFDIDKLRKILEDTLNIDVRTCIVGYVQRGGNPTKKEIKMAKGFAKQVCNQICKNNFNSAIIVKNNIFVSASLNSI